MHKRWIRTDRIDDSIRLSIMERESNRTNHTVCASIYMSNNHATQLATELLEIINQKKMERVEKSK